MARQADRLRKKEAKKRVLVEDMADTLYALAGRRW